MLSVDELVDRLIDLSFAEDIGDGDHTTLCCIPEDAMGKSHLLIKEDGILAGVEIAKEVFRRFDPTMQVEVLMGDGTRVKKGDIAMVVTGKIRSLLQTERLMLNIMQRMSGIATMTDRYVQRLKGTNTRVLDTRKTTPGMRMLEKQAVKIGGGCNHRIGLFDMILLKDNHVDFAGGITNAIDRCHAYLKEKGLDLKIEIEVRSFDELQQVLDHGGVNRIMLDNFSVPDTKKAVDIIGGRYETESSGGITYDTIRDYAEQGVDFISVGALTHSVKGLDMSLSYDISLAGNFGEPRPHHFHGGIDIKTDGVEGKAIYAIGDGYVSRVTMGLYGFGNAVYVTHPEGYTSVYCHLKAFTPRIKAALRRYQYQHETSEGDARFSPLECPVSQGQLIAISGNTGNSMGPHLHLEIHDTETWDMLDPYDFLADYITDTIPPKVRGMMIYPQAGEGIVNGKSTKQTILVTGDKQPELKAEGLG